MTANLQRALHLLEDGCPRVQWAGGGSPQGTGRWSFRGDDDGGGDSGGDCGGGGGGGADGLLRVSGTGLSSPLSTHLEISIKATHTVYEMASAQL